jgi:hypothetical protein
MKVCSNCEIEKNLESFYPKVNQCKNCISVKAKKYQEKNKDILLEKKKQYYQANKCIVLQKSKNYYNLKKEKIAENFKIYYHLNKEKAKKYFKDYYKTNRQLLIKKAIKYNQDNKEIKIEYNKKHYEANREKRIKKQTQYDSNRLKTDPVFKFKRNTRGLIRGSFKKINHRKNSKTADILGCSLDFFKEYIQSKLKKNMTFDNYGDWHLDHIIPLATAKTEEDVIRLNHYTNFQPLWAKENLSKSDKIITKQLILI